MKKTLSVVALALLTATGAMAQKADVKAAEKIATSTNANFAEARRLATQTLQNDETKADPYAWYVAGLVEHEAFKKEYAKMLLPNGGADTLSLYNSLLAEVPYYVKTYELETVPDEKGKIKLKYGKKAKETLKDDMQLLLNAGNYFIDKKDYPQGAKAYTTYLGLRKSPMYADDKAIATPDTTMMEVAYFAALLNFESKDYDEAIRVVNEYKGQDYKKEDLYQILASSYASKTDTTSFLKVLGEGMELFPKSIYFVGNLVQTYANQGKTDQAIATLKTAIDRDGSNVNLLNFMGGLYEQKEDWKTSGEYYKKALAAQPDDFSANYNMARSLYNQAVTILGADKVDKLAQDKAEKLLKDTVPYFEAAYKQKPAEVYYLYANVCDRLGLKDRYAKLMEENK